MMNWVIAYDVSQDRNRVRLAKLLVANGIRIQKSVFLVEATRGQVDNLTQQMARHIDKKTDSVCAWPLAEAWRQQQKVVPPGTELMPETFIIA
jgi:CRISPR-associated protein Cas2